jgi:prepilin-type N-terminal cleavage/methylation domain-containing protein
MNMHSKPGVQQRGMTLIEVIVSVAIVSVIMAMMFPAFRMSADTMNDGALQAELDQKAAMIADEIANNIRMAKGSTITIPPGTVDISNVVNGGNTDGSGLIDTTVANTGTLSSTSTSTSTDITVTTGAGSTVVLNKGGTEIQFQQIIDYKVATGELILGANLNLTADDPTTGMGKFAVPNATVSYGYQKYVVNGVTKHCLVAKINGSDTNSNGAHILTDQLAPVYSYFQQTNKGVKIQIIIQQVNQKLFIANPTGNPSAYTMYGIASTTVVPEVP